MTNPSPISEISSSRSASGLHEDPSEQVSIAVLESDRALATSLTLLTRLFRNVNRNLTLRLWNGEIVRVGLEMGRELNSTFELVFHGPLVVRSMILGRDPLRIAEAYFRGDMDIEGDFFAAVGLKDDLQSIHMSLSDRLRTLYQALQLKPLAAGRPGSAAPSRARLRTVTSHSKEENRAAIKFHYDVSNDFYALWLDKNMVYSCAYFEAPNIDLDQAQEAKLEHICRKLQLQPTDQLLDIGCGWGALIIYAAKHYGVRARGITLSLEQLRRGRELIAEAGLGNRVTIDLQDYRELEGQSVYEKISSVGMVEHVGLKNLPRYFSTVQRLLKPGGLFLNHGITSDSGGWEKTLSTEFINRYVFPDGQLDTISNLQRHMEQARFEITDVESLRSHYALTLRHWVKRLEENHAEALQFVNEFTYRVWRLYMSAAAIDFESGQIGIYQVLATKRGAALAPTPMTRRHLYSDEAKLPASCAARHD
jgi:cyclopropane-fatty-acyl-phospholipid synthase